MLKRRESFLRRKREVPILCLRVFDLQGERGVDLVIYRALKRELLPPFYLRSTIRLFY